MRRLIFPLFLGLGGLAVLLGLGIWQLQRLHWKEAILADIDWPRRSMCHWPPIR